MKRPLPESQRHKPTELRQNHLFPLLISLSKLPGRRNALLSILAVRSTKPALRCRWMRSIDQHISCRSHERLWQQGDGLVSAAP